MGSTIATLLAKLELDTSGFQKSIAGIPGMMGNIGSGMTQVGGSITRGVTLPLVAAGAATVALATMALKTGADFEKAMSGVGAILGSTKDEIKLLSDEAIQLGLDPNLIVSASEAAAVMEELAKNGLTATEILGGAAEAAIALANATGVDMATGAQIASTAMKLFNIDAKDMTDVVDQITAVANMSRFTAEDFAQAIGMGGAAAQSAGVSFEDFTATIAALSEVTASGSDAGTSFKTFLTRLVPATDKAEEAMAELGIITEDGANRFFDAEGNMKSMAEVAGILDETLSGLSEEQRILALNTIFGTDASRAAIGLMQTGEQGFIDLQKAMADTDAAENAATRMDNLAGSIEIMTGVIEAFQIKFSQALGPGVRSIVETFTNFLSSNSKQVEGLFASLSLVMTGLGESFGPWLQQNGPKMIEFFQKMIEALPGLIAQLVEIGTVAAPMIEKLFTAFINMDPNTIVNIATAIGALAIIGPIIATIGTLITTIATIAPMFAGIGTVITTLVSWFWTASVAIGSFIAGGILLPLLVIIGTIALVYLAFKNNFMGITTTVQQLGFIIKHFAEQAWLAMTTAFNDMYNSAVEKFNGIKTTIQQLKAIFDFVMKGISNAIQKVIVKVMELAKALLSIVLPGDLTPGSPTPFEIGLLGIADAMNKVNTTGLDGIQNSTAPSLPNMNGSSSSSNNGGQAGSSSRDIIINITNPKQETSEESVRKTLKNLSYLGVVK